MTDTYTGSCLCGAVAYEVDGPFEAFHICHCSRCRKSTSSAFACNLFTRPDAIRWLRGEDQTRRFELPEAKRFARAFCETCGSGVPYTNRTGTALVVPAGTLNGMPPIEPQDQIFWKHRAPWYDAVIAAPVFDEYPD